MTDPKDRKIPDASFKAPGLPPVLTVLEINEAHRLAAAGEPIPAKLARRLLETYECLLMGTGHVMRENDQLRAALSHARAGSVVSGGVAGPSQTPAPMMNPEEFEREFGQGVKQLDPEAPVGEDDGTAEHYAKTLAVYALELSRAVEPRGIQRTFAIFVADSQVISPSGRVRMIGYCASNCGGGRDGIRRLVDGVMSEPESSDGFIHVPRGWKA